MPRTSDYAIVMAMTIHSAEPIFGESIDQLEMMADAMAETAAKGDEIDSGQVAEWGAFLRLIACAAEHHIEQIKRSACDFDRAKAAEPIIVNMPEPNKISSAEGARDYAEIVRLAARAKYSDPDKAEALCWRIEQVEHAARHCDGEPAIVALNDAAGALRDALAANTETSPAALATKLGAVLNAMNAGEDWGEAEEAVLESTISALAA